ncbi:MAG: hypothetical protein WDO13_12730 [Verrucomicrobiota bacterium]
MHGTLNALFLNLVLLFFYLWMIEPQKTHRLIFTVLIFSLGLTNHHTLVQIIPRVPGRRGTGRCRTQRPPPARGDSRVGPPRG